MVHARAQRALEQARRAYAASKFRRCAELLATSGEQLQHQLSHAADLRLVKRLELWLGLCQHLAGAEAAAAAAWTRGARLPGPGPDPDLFPPQVMKRYRALTEGEQVPICTLGPTARGTQIDGKPATPGGSVAQGEHYVVWPELKRSARRTLGARCRLAAPAHPGPGTDRISVKEATDTAFLVKVGRAAKVSELWLLEGTVTSLKASLFDVGSARFAPSQQLEPLPPPEPASTPATPATRAPTPWYGRWWVWTLIGAGVAAAVVIPVVATQEERYDLVF